MARHLTEKPHAPSTRAALRLAPLATAVAIAGAVAWPQGSAEAAAIRPAAWVATLAYGHGPVVNTGNGKRNKNYAPSINSPTIQRGVQNVSSTSESTNTQSAFCKKGRRVCRIKQRLKFVRR
ncbi:hypothetical protein [Microtetraspora malaysiensis]|uniref:hypothetical protein n=1 Tax=Microtetraspora malaysiensis TaxID=161358 RepID=UPI00083640EC|nr:hypothetical protein [Microtetraspora malaysiensis]